MSKKRIATMSDVAAHAGVSIKTVSNVINDWPYVTDETRQKVQQAIETVGYRPNHLARSLVTGKTHSIGVVVPDLSNPFFSTALRGCEDLLFGDYNLFVCNTNEDLAREQQSIADLLSRSVDGLILWGTRIGGEQLANLVGDAIPLVTVELSDEPISPNHININVDNLTGARLATEHLIASGHKRIAHVAGPMDRITSRLRQQGYQQALTQAGLPCPECLVTSTRPSLGEAARTVLTLLEEQKPDAIFCFNDLMAIGTLLAARRLNLRVPDDLGVVGFDDIPMASLVNPLLTTVRIAQYQLGRLCGELMGARLRGEATDRQILFPVELVVRESCSAHAMTHAERIALLDSLIATRY